MGSVKNHRVAQLAEPATFGRVHVAETFVDVGSNPTVVIPFYAILVLIEARLQ